MKESYIPELLEFIFNKLFVAISLGIVAFVIILTALRTLGVQI